MDVFGYLSLNVPSNIDVDASIIEGVRENMRLLNGGVTSGDIVVKKNKLVYLAEMNEEFVLLSTANKFQWRWYGFEMWLDSETSILVGSLVFLAGLGVSTITKVGLINRINNAIGGPGNTVNYINNFLATRIGVLIPVINGILLGSLAIQAGLASTGIGSVFALALKIFIVVYGGYVSGKGLTMATNGVMHGRSYTKFRFGKITVTA